MRMGRAAVSLNMIFLFMLGCAASSEGPGATSLLSSQNKKQTHPVAIESASKPVSKPSDVIWPGSGGNALYLHSEADEAILAGSEIYFNSPVLHVSFYWEGLKQVLDIQMPGAKPIRISMSSPENEKWEAKTYDYVRALRSEFPRHAGLNVTVGSSTTGDLEARIQVLELIRNKQGEVDSLAVDFIKRHEDGLGSHIMMGAIRLHSHIPIHRDIKISAVHDSLNLLHSEFSVVDYLGIKHSLTNTQGDFAIRNFDQLGINNIFQYEQLEILFAANWGEGRDGSFGYTSHYSQRIGLGAEAIPSVGMTTNLDICRARYQNLRILEIKRDEQNKIIQFAANFELFCDFSSAVERAFIRYHSNFPVP